MSGSGKVAFKRISPTRWALSVLWILLCLVGLGYYTFTQLERQRVQMERSGWGRYLKASSPLEFYWRCQQDTGCTRILGDGVLDNTSITVFVVVLVAGLAGLIRPERYTPRRTLSQRWANEKDVAPLVERRRPQEIIDAALRGEPPLSGYLGVWTDPNNPRRRLFLRPTKRLNDVHSITYAGTGGGKTVGSFRPRIALDAAEGNIAVVLDTKYPNPNDSYVDMRDYFRAFGRQVTVINPFELGDGIQIPVLTEVRGYSQALDVARLIYPPDLEEGEDPGAKVYISNARLLLAGIIHGLSLGPREARNFREVYQVANLGMEGVRQWFNGRPQAADEIRSTLETDKKIFSGAINRLVEDLSIFRTDSAVETFSPGPREVDLTRVLLTPGMIHLVLPESYIRGSSGRAILRFFKRYLDGQMLSLAERLTRPLPVHINYYYDEFALFGFLPNLNDDLATLRSRNISLHMALQNRSQAINIYGEHGWAATVDNNIGTTVILPGSFTQNDAKYWSETLGEVSIEQYSIGETQVPEHLGKKINRSLNVKEERTALINIDELQRMELGELIAVVRGFPPIRLRSYPVEFPASAGNPIAWIHDYVVSWKKAHLRQALQNGWLEEAWRVLSSDPPAPAEAAPPTPEPEPELTPELVQQRFSEWMERLAREQIGVQAEGQPGQVRRYILNRALEMAPLEEATLRAFVELGYLRYRRGLYYIAPEKCPWGRSRLALWEAGAYVQYRSTPEGAVL
jgi:hypothetical protein